MAGMAGLGALSRIAEWTTKARLTALQTRLEQLESHGSGVREAACEQIRIGGPLTRVQAAEFLVTSTKKLQRMEAAGTLSRCSGWGTDVRYSARDVLRLASANGKER